MMNQRINNSSSSNYRMSIIVFPLFWSLLLVFSSQHVTATAAVAAQKSWTLWHSFDSGKTFTERGVLTLGLLEEDGTLEMKLKQQENCVVVADPLKLQSELYQLKIISSTDEMEILTSVPACQIRRANFRDELIVTLNGKAEPVSLDYHPLVSPLAPSCDELSTDPSSSTEFTTINVRYETANIGMIIPPLLPETKPPAGMQFFSKPGSNKDGGGGTESFPGPKGLIMKYWYIILPLFVMMLLGGEAPTDEKQQGSSGDTQGAVAPRVAAAPAAGGGGGGGGARQRRGKR